MTRATAGFSPLTMLVVLLVGVVSLAGLGLLSAYAPELKSGDDGGPHALSRSATGYGALPPLLRNLDVPVVLARGPLGAGGADSLMILTPSPTTEPDRIADIRHLGPTLIVLPKWNVAPNPDHPGWVSTVGLIPPGQALSVLPEAQREGTTLSPAADTGVTRLRRGAAVPVGVPVGVDEPRRIAGDQWLPVVVDANGQGVLVVHRQTGTYVLADPDLLATHGLKSLDGARTAVALLDVIRPRGAPVAFDLTLHGFQRTRNLGRLMLEPPLLGMTLALVALAGFAGLQATVRFGPARQAGRAVAMGKRALADNTAALVRIARREHHMAVPYALLIRAAVARAIGAPRGLSEAELDAFLDRISGIVGATTPYSTLAASAQAARTPGDLMRVARDLHRWNQELTRERQ